MTSKTRAKYGKEIFLKISDTGQSLSAKPAIGGWTWRHQKHYYANHNQFAPNFDMGCETIQSVSVPHLKLFRPIQTKLWAKKFGEFSIMQYGKMGWWPKVAHRRGCHNMYVWRFSRLWTAVTFAFIGISTWNLQRTIKMRLFTLCKNFV